MRHSAKIMAQLYRDAIVKILANPNSTYSVEGASFTKHDLQKLETLHDKWIRRANRAIDGCRTVAGMN